MQTHFHSESSVGLNPEERRTIVNCPAIVTEIWDITPTVKSLSLFVSKHQGLDYKAGQWLEFKISELKRMGSFTMCTSPLKFKKTGEIQLAVKYSDHAPTKWVHTQCAVGSQITISFGGNFFYNPEKSQPKQDLLLIGGGIGVNPLYCIMNLVADYNAMVKEGDSDCYTPGNLRLLYSVKTEKDIQFKDQMEKLMNENENIKCKFFLTQEESKNMEIINRRINREDIEEALDKLNRDNCYVYVCAPPEMMDDVEEMLEDLKFDSNKIRIGRWW